MFGNKRLPQQKVVSVQDLLDLYQYLNNISNRTTEEKNALKHLREIIANYIIGINNTPSVG